MKTRIPLLASVMVVWLLSLADATAFYDPGLQRWINRDPIGEEDCINLYEFVGGDAVNWFDDFGHRGGRGGRGTGRRGPIQDIPGRPRGMEFRWGRPLTPQENLAAEIQMCIRRETANARQRAVDQAWKQERILVEKTGSGTVRWSRPEQKELLATGRVSEYYGHHINNVASRPDLAGNPNNIKFVNWNNHFALHGGSWRNPTSGDLLNRSCD